jgi:hypothetical protein
LEERSRVWQRLQPGAGKKLVGVGGMIDLFRAACVYLKCPERCESTNRMVEKQMRIWFFLRPGQFADQVLFPARRCREKEPGGGQ